MHSDFWWDLARPCEVCMQRGKLLYAQLSAPISVGSLTLRDSFLSGISLSGDFPVLGFRGECNAGGPGV